MRGGVVWRFHGYLLPIRLGLGAGELVFEEREIGQRLGLLRSSGAPLEESQRGIAVAG